MVTGSDTRCAFSGVSFGSTSCVSGSSPTTISPVLETPRGVATRSSRTPTGASGAAVTFSVTLSAEGLVFSAFASAGFAPAAFTGAAGGTISAVRPSPSKRTLYAPAKS